MKKKINILIILAFLPLLCIGQITFKHPRKVKIGDLSGGTSQDTLIAANTSNTLTKSTFTIGDLEAIINASGNWVTLDTEQTIIAKKTFQGVANSEAIIIDVDGENNVADTSTGLKMNLTSSGGKVTGIDLTIDGVTANTGMVINHNNSSNGLEIINDGGVGTNLILREGNNSSGAALIYGKATIYQNGTNAGLDVYGLESQAAPAIRVAGNNLIAIQSSYGTIDENLDEVDVEMNVNTELDIGTVSGNTIYVSVPVGASTTLTKLGPTGGTTGTGAKRTLIFRDSLTIVHDVNTLILPGEQNIDVSPGDVMQFVKGEGGIWHCINYERNSNSNHLQEITIDGFTGDRLEPIKSNIHGFYVDKEVNGRVGLEAVNTSTGTSAGASLTVRSELDPYSNFGMLINFGSNHAATFLRNKPAVFSANDLFFIAGNDSSFDFRVGSNNGVLSDFVSALTIDREGLINAPLLDNAKIDAASDTVLVPKGWVKNSISNTPTPTFFIQATDSTGVLTMTREDTTAYIDDEFGRIEFRSTDQSLEPGDDLMSSLSSMASVNIGVGSEATTDLVYKSRTSESQSVTEKFRVVGTGDITLTNDTNFSFTVGVDALAVDVVVTPPDADGKLATQEWTDSTVGADVATLQANQLDGIERYNTLTDLQAVGTPSTTTRYAVTRDGSNNGYYSYNGTTFDWDGALSLESVNFIDFVTNSTDRNKILTQNNTQDEAANVTYWNDMIAYVKANNVRKVIFPTGLYRFEQCIADDVDDVIFQGENAIIKWDIVTGGTAIWRFTNSNRVEITGFTFGTDYASYQDVDFIEVGSGSGWFTIHHNNFYNILRSAIRVHSLFGGASSQGAFIHNNIFRSSSNYSNVNQTCILFENDGEYSKVMFNEFNDIPSAVRFVNGSANCTFAFNYILSSDSEVEAGSLNHALIYADNVGTNEGKLDILYNKINHNPDGTLAIIIRGGGSLITASRVIGNDILVNGNATQAKVMYFLESENLILRDNKMTGWSAAPHDTAIKIENSDYVTVENNSAKYYNIFLEAVNSTDIKYYNNHVEDVTTEISLDGSSSIAPLTMKNTPVYADDAAAGAGGLIEGQIYKTATGEVRIKN